MFSGAPLLTTMLCLPCAPRSDIVEVGTSIILVAWAETTGTGVLALFGRTERIPRIRFFATFPKVAPTAFRRDFRDGRSSAALYFRIHSCSFSVEPIVSVSMRPPAAVPPWLNLIRHH